MASGSPISPAPVAVNLDCDRQVLGSILHHPSEPSARDTTPRHGPDSTMRLMDARASADMREPCLLKTHIHSAHARQTHAVAALRVALAAIDNAEAAGPSAAPPLQHGVIAGGVAGLGAGEVPRKMLSTEAATMIVERENRERMDAPSTYSGIGPT